jgi:hypothetical protein
MKVLIACEESQTVCIAFRELGHEAYSCDIQDCSGGHPEWHIKDDAIKILYSENWDLMIAHPPCTYLSISGNNWFNILKYGIKAEQRFAMKEHAIQFFIKLYNSNINKICIENPVGFMNTQIKPDQIIQPWMFGDEYQKKTCLWLKNLPQLKHINEDDLFDQKTHVNKGEFFEWVDGKTGKNKRQPLWYYKAKKNKNLTSKLRSKTFPGIAKAMAIQWGKL